LVDAKWPGCLHRRRAASSCFLWAFQFGTPAICWGSFFAGTDRPTIGFPVSLADPIVWSCKAWRRRRILKKASAPEQYWNDAYEALPVLGNLSGEERERLRTLAILFLHEKSVEGVQGLQLTERMRLIIALQGCVPILHLGLEWYSGWKSVLVYPYQFVTDHQQMDESGVVHRVRRHLSGESWLRGPVVVSWPDVAEACVIDGHNLIIHEFAHKLDMLNGRANGFPPLHHGMDGQTWARVFTRAFEDLRRRIELGRPLPIDPYGATEPAEFFAVLSEVYFETPQVLQVTYPDVYDQLQAFYHPVPPLIKP
jgi:MtfA peptidase